jgi:hypothetical protein
MDQTITINSKVFNVIERPTPTSAVLRTISRGANLPDLLRIAHQVVKSKLFPAKTIQRSLYSFGRVYTPDSGSSYDTGYVKISLELPSDMDATNRDAMLADLTDWLASAITLRATNVAALVNRETP